mgnify:CR=1 FL=1
MEQSQLEKDIEKYLADLKRIELKRDTRRKINEQRILAGDPRGKQIL